MFPRFWKDETEQHCLPAESTLDHPLVTPAELPVEDVRGSQSSPAEVEIEEELRWLADLDDRSAEPGEVEEDDDAVADVEPDEVPPRFFPRYKPRRRKTPLLVKPEEVARLSFSPQQRLLLLDTWQRSGLPAKDFAELVGVSKHTLYKWRQLFERLGPEGLLDQSKGRRHGSRLPEVTKRTILMLKQAHPEWGCGTGVGTFLISQGT